MAKPAKVSLDGPTAQGGIPTAGPGNLRHGGANGFVTHFPREVQRQAQRRGRTACLPGRPRLHMMMVKFLFSLVITLWYFG